MSACAGENQETKTSDRSQNTRMTTFVPRMANSCS